MKSLSLLRLVVAASAAALMSSCAATASTPERTGRLVIIGGSLGDNEAIYDRMIEYAGTEPSIGILPTASGVPEESGPYYVEAFDDRIGAEVTELIDIPYNQPENAKSIEIAAAMGEKTMLFFTGGDQSRITAAFLPDDAATPAYDACWDVLAAGGTIAGTSAGAAMMSDPMLRWGPSDEALLIGMPDVPDRGVGVGRGMGFFPYGLTGQHFLRRGRAGRMIAALEYASVPRGFGIADSRAIDVDLATGQIEAIGGERAVLMIDVSDATKDGLARENIRLSLLNDGDLVDGQTGEVTPSPRMTPVPEDIVGLTVLIEEPDAWDRDVFAKVME